ncbi:hypothetical protein [Planomonospora parontospora]|uniref:hypothetical protein n=1 Tax=Planomonospora parontospora TaxID=58119 RepID=UPI0016716851|nr:hypothetical protein [Planomonospora parontospora]GGL59015.1 hypothetical protein GCM10014719_70570 [Planomonospora parontospora subsp. antibiotica]GII20278.1 hypothetical protein Ppa05_70040 [Planomonospora parontospora subsp. antibiotica]
MSTIIRFGQLYDWALLPHKHKVARVAEREAAEMYEKHFRYNRRVRPATSCPPWVLGQELGWVVQSPIDITLTPVDDIQFGAESETDLTAVSRMLNRTDVWNRGDGWLATSRNDWLRFTQFKGIGDNWEAMFLPNGDGSVEWRLGWTAQIPDDMYLMVMGLDRSEAIEIPTGIMTAKQVNRTADNGGMSLAIRPRHVSKISRGTPLARLVLLHRQSLQAMSEEIN